MKHKQGLRVVKTNISWYDANKQVKAKADAKANSLVQQQNGEYTDN